MDKNTNELDLYREKLANMTNPTPQDFDEVFESLGENIKAISNYKNVVTKEDIAALEDCYQKLLELRNMH